MTDRSTMIPELVAQALEDHNELGKWDLRVQDALDALGAAQRRGEISRLEKMRMMADLMEALFVAALSRRTMLAETAIEALKRSLNSADFDDIRRHSNYASVAALKADDLAVWVMRTAEASKQD